jgi:tetratricopeptide (TPR) repeat protein
MPQNSSHACSDSLTSEQIDALWDIHDPVEGESKLKNAVVEYPGSVDELRTQIARSLGLQSRFGEAWDELSNISIVHSQLVEIRIQLEKGRLENSSGTRNYAKPHFLKALELAQQEDLDFYAVDAAHMLGIVSEGQESIQWNKLALQLAADSRFERTHNWKGSLLSNLGWTYFNIGEFDSALATFDSAFDFEKAAGNPVRIRIARWTVARCLRALKRYDDAFAIQNDLIQYPEQGYVSEELGELLLVLGRPDEASLRFRKAHELLSQSLGSDPSQANRLARLRELYQ